MHQDFLQLDVNGSSLSQVKAILLDPSCSGSGTSNRRLDHLLPSFTSTSANKEQIYGGVDLKRLEKLACFQEKALRFALSFPAVERVVYSTCSIHQRENEDVVKAVLGYASNNGFRLGVPLPQWQHRGLPVFEGATNLLRVEPSQDMDGFFVALFERHTGDSVEMGHERDLSVVANFSRSSERKEEDKCKRKQKANTLVASRASRRFKQSWSESGAAMNDEQEDGARPCKNGHASRHKRKRMGKCSKLTPFQSEQSPENLTKIGPPSVLLFKPGKSQGSCETVNAKTVKPKKQKHRHELAIKRENIHLS